MLDHGLQTQVGAALRHALALTGPEQYHRHCALIIEVVRQANETAAEAVLATLAHQVLEVGFPQEHVREMSRADLKLMMALEAVFDILAAHRLPEVLSGVRGMAHWMYVCLAEGDHERLAALAQHINNAANSFFAPRSQELH